jgi:hypothetical protein
MPNNGVMYGMLAALRQSATLRQSELREEAAEQRRARISEAGRESRILDRILPSRRRRN